MYVNVLVGVNGLAGDQDAVVLAKTLALGRHRPTLVHVRVVDGTRSRGSNNAFDLATSELSKELLTRCRTALAPGAEVTSVSATSVGAGLHQVAESRGADLIVVGSCHLSAAGRIFAGDDARSVIHHAPCAVVVAPLGYAGKPERIAMIAAAYDGSAESEVAVAHAALLAADLDAKVLARSVVELRVYGGGWISAGGALEDPETAVGEAREQLGALPGIELDVFVGVVREELAALSERVDLMICGSRHQGAIKRVVLGSTSDYLARESACPLLITPATDEKALAAWYELRDAAAAV
jgi:nucleotide-binding universal stress UspA family protein